MKRTLSAVVAAALLLAPIAHAQDDDDSEDDESSAMDALTKLDAPTITAGRLAFVAGGALLVGGMGLGYFAQGQARRAESVDSAVDTRNNLREAQATAQTANLLYLAAGITLLYGLVLEVLPEPVANKANLTFHF